eukprot:1178401-Prorocentrum_lima.AAC.1
MCLPWPIALSPVAPVRAVSELPSGREEERQEGDMVGRARVSKGVFGRLLWAVGGHRQGCVEAGLGRAVS